jgi:hypothetical protein
MGFVFIIIVVLYIPSILVFLFISSLIKKLFLSKLIFSIVYAILFFLLLAPAWIPATHIMVFPGPNILFLTGIFTETGRKYITYDFQHNVVFYTLSYIFSLLIGAYIGAKRHPNK